MNKNISTSQLTLYAECPLKYKFQYIDKLEKPAVSVHLAYGSAIHKALEYMNTQTNAQILDIYQVFHDSYLNEMSKMNLDPFGYYNAGLYLTAIKSLEKYFVDFYQTYEPTIYKDENGEKPSLECKFTVPIYDKDGSLIEGYSYHGIIDVVGVRDKKIFVLDYKTAKEDYTPFKIKTSIQLTLYAYAIRHLLKNGNFPNIKKKQEDFTLYHILIKSDSPEIIEKKKIISERDINRLLYITKTFIKGVNNQIFIPNYQENCKWCQYKQNCLEFDGSG